jgi:hypothetical protein
MLQPDSHETMPTQESMPTQEAIPAQTPLRTNFVWRFYVDADGAWRWQQLGTDSKVFGESPGSHGTYEVCVADAEAHGYRYAPSQAKVGPPPRASAMRAW